VEEESITLAGLQRQRKKYVYLEHTVASTFYASTRCVQPSLTLSDAYPYRKSDIYGYQIFQIL
jgi:hypothetical protein